MKLPIRPAPVWYASAILAFVAVKLGWIAANTTPDPRYLLGGWRFVAVFVACSVAFFVWPYSLRWVLAPYFLLSALGGLARISQVEFSIWAALSMVLLFAQAIVAFLLFRMKKESNHPPQPTALSRRG